MTSVVAFALRNRFLVVLAFLGLIGAGLFAFTRLNIEAYPDPVPPMVDIITQSPGQSAEEIERYITIPIEVQVAALPYLTAVRSISLFGLSDVKLQFTYDFTYLQAEQQVLNRLAQLPQLPNGAQPTISPTSPIGEIYRYRVVGPGYSVTDLKTIQDWILARRFRAVPGVIDVTGWGGKTKTYEVTVDLNKLTAYGLTLPQMLQSLNNSNINVGGGTVNIGPQVAVVRGVGLVQSMADIEDTMLASVDGAPVRIKDVATVQVGHLPRLGIAGQDGDDDIVQGIVLMRRGQESLPTIRRVKAEVRRINSSNVLPPGVHIERIYDRSELIQVTTRTVLHNLLFGIGLIFLVQWLFLGNLRSAVIVSATIPFAFLFAAGIMVMRGESGNLLSIGAIDFGLIVDATVIMVENIFRHLGEQDSAIRPPPAVAAATAAGLVGKLATILEASSEVNRSIFFAASIIIAGFVPLFGMSGVEGHIFAPMSKTYAYALSGGLLATFTVSPVLCAVLLPARTNEIETAIVRWARRVYRPLLAYALRYRKRTLGAATLLLAVAAVAASQLGLEFLPHLEEGNLWIRATLPSTISLEEGNAYVNEMRKLIESFPETVTVVSQHGRPDDGTDATGFFNAEFFVPLKPADRWPRGVDKAKLTEQVSKALERKFPGVEFNFSQYIEDNVEEAVSGVKGENSVKVFGQDLDQIAKTADRIEAVLATVPGIADLAVFTSLGQPTIAIDIDRDRAARYGLSPGDINATVQAAIGGQQAGDLYERGSDRHFPIIVRLAPEYRQSLDAIRHITVGAQGTKGIMPIPLGDVANVRLVSGPSFIYREGQQRYIPIKFSVVGRDLGSTVLEAQRRVAAEVHLQPDQHLDWVGEFQNLTSAVQRLSLLVPLSLLLICLLLYVNFSSAVDMALAVSVIPMAMIGGIFALVVTGTPFSVSAAIGFVALFGISVMDGIIVLSSFNHLVASGESRGEAILEACHTQFRPVLMTCVAACVGLVPAALSTGIGSQVQKPLALVVVGGISLAPFLILLVLPVLIVTFSRRGLPHARGAAAEPSPAE